MFKKKWYFYLLWLALGGVFFLLYNTSTRVFEGNIALRIQNFYDGIRNSYISVIDDENLKHENLLLKQKIAEYEKEIAQLEITRNDLETIVQEQNIYLPKENKLLFSNVLNNNEIFITGRRIVNVGEKDMVKKGNLVIAHGAFVGEIVEIYAHTAVIQLISHNDSSYAVMLDDNSLGTLKGQFDENNLLLTKIPREAKISIGTTVRLAPTLLYPHRSPVLVGTIRDVIDVKEAPYLEAIVTPALDYKSLREVFIMLEE